MTHRLRVPSPVAANADAMRVHVFAPWGRDSELILDALRGAGIACEATDEVRWPLTSVDQIGALVLTADATTPSMLAALNADFQAQPSWSAAPVVLLMRPDASGTLGTHRAEALAFCSHAIVVDLPVEAAQLVQVVRFALESRRRQYLARDLQQSLEDMVASRTARLRATTHQLGHAEQGERRRLATVLHDDFQQLLVGASMHLVLLEDEHADAARRSALATVQELLNQAIDVSRSLTGDLNPPTLLLDGLATALRRLAKQMQQRHHLDVTVNVGPGVHILHEDNAAFLLAATRELLFNIVKHAGVDRATVRLRQRAGMARLVVEDRGVGMMQPTLAVQDGGYGLSSVRHRLEAIGGRLQIEVPPGGGCRVTMDVPTQSETVKPARRPPRGLRPPA